MDPTDDNTPDTTPDAPADTTPPDTTPPATDEGATPPELEPPRAEPTDADARALAAMDKGLEKAKKATIDDDGTIVVPPSEKKARKEKAPPVPRETPATGEAPVPGTPEALAAGDAAAASPAPPPPPTESDKAIDAELAAMDIKSSSERTRVREIISDNHAYRAAFEKMGLDAKKLAEQVPKFMEQHDQATQVIQGVLNTGATGEQYGRTLAYLEMTVGASSGNRRAAEAAYKVAMEEANHWAKMLGLEVPGVFDPLAEHKDLQEDVEYERITRERALEIAGYRAAGKQNEVLQQQTTAQRQEAALAAKADEQIQAFDQSQLRDPAYATYYRPALDQEVANIKARYPAAEWVQRTQDAYALLRRIPIPRAVPAPAPAPAARTPTKDQPVQTRNRVPGPAGRPVLEPKVPKDPMAALEMGLASLNR